MNTSDSKINRREFLQKSAVVVTASATLSTTALSYARIVGANERISLGHIGIGNRGRELDGIAAVLKETKNAEVTAVCDLWTRNLEQAVAANQRYFGKAPRALQHPQELLALKDVDAVMISTPEHSHSPLLKMTAEEVKAARDAVVARNLIVQIGTQHRSEPYQIAVRDLIRSGVLGEVSKYEIER